MTEIHRIGSFNIDMEDVFNEDRIGDFHTKNVGTMFIEVYNKEGQHIPHFHFFIKDKKINGCLQIFKPEYFIHGRHKSTLTNKQLKQMYDYLKGYTFKTASNWQRIVYAWYGENTDNKYKPILKVTGDPSNTANMPNYLELLK